MADVFALQNSGMNAFLFAEVGRQLDGSDLTVLSMLARLDKDPWVEAGTLAKGPRAATIAWVAAGIARMPLGALALEDAVATATRLVALLPGPEEAGAAAAPGRPAGRWPTLVMLCLSLAFSLGLTLLVQSSSLPEGPAAAGTISPAR